MIRNISDLDPEIFFAPTINKENYKWLRFVLAVDIKQATSNMQFSEKCESLNLFDYF